MKVKKFIFREKEKKIKDLIMEEFLENTCIDKGTGECYGKIDKLQIKLFETLNEKEKILYNKIIDLVDEAHYIELHHFADYIFYFLRTWNE